MAACSPHKAFCLNLQMHTGKRIREEDTESCHLCASFTTPMSRAGLLEQHLALGAVPRFQWCYSC